MAAEDSLQSSLDALAERLRAEVSRQIDTVAGELKSSFDAERAQAAAASEEERTRALAEAAAEHEDAIGRARQAARDEAERDAAERLSSARAEERDVARSEALELARAEHEAAGFAALLRLADGVRAIDRGKSLSEILDALASAAAAEAPRAGVLLVGGAGLRAWRLARFEPALDAATDFEMPLADAGIIADAVHTGAAVALGDAPTSSAPVFASLPPGREAIALPLSMSGQTVAALYADQGVAGTVRHLGWSAALEILTRHAARSLEAITATRAAQIFTDRPGASSAAAPRQAPRPPQPAPAGQTEDEESARRYARLLISEIKLYHEAAVVAGRRERDLADRLGGEITHARVLYEQRVPPHVRQQSDFFHEELISTLADGDATLLAKV